MSSSYSERYASCQTALNSINVGGDDANALNVGGGDSPATSLSSDLSAPGAAALTGVSATNLFVSTTLGSEDFHLMDAVAAVDAGKDLITFTTDIDGDIRPAGAWDIGADERP